MRSSVDLPQPLRPSRATNWPDVRRVEVVDDGAPVEGAGEPLHAYGGVLGDRVCRPVAVFCWAVAPFWRVTGP